MVRGVAAGPVLCRPAAQIVLAGGLEGAPARAALHFAGQEVPRSAPVQERVEAITPVRPERSSLPRQAVVNAVPQPILNDTEVVATAEAGLLPSLKLQGLHREGQSIGNKAAPSELFSAHCRCVTNLTQGNGGNPRPLRRDSFGQAVHDFGHRAAAFPYGSRDKTTKVHQGGPPLPDGRASETARAGL
jgi:hypothetical protein